MYKILCLTSGDFIRANRSLAARSLHVSGVPKDIKDNMSGLLKLNNWSYDKTHWDYVVFDTEEAAKWFISHRLVYNPRRKNVGKIGLMKDLFDFNNVPGWETCKLEFEIQKI